MGEMRQYVDEPGHTDENGFDNVDLHIYTGADGEVTLYEDDGISLAYERDGCTRTIIRWNDTAKKVTISGTTSIHPQTTSRSSAFHSRFWSISGSLCRVGSGTIRVSPIVAMS